MTRRQVLALSISAPFAALGSLRAAANQGLGQFAATGPPACNASRTLTPAADDRQFRPGSPSRTALAGPDSPGKKLTLSGAVIGIRCGAIKDAVVDIWQADASGVLDATGFRLRGHQNTDADGRFHFDTIVPGPAAGHARHLGVKVQPPGKPALTTVLFFPDDPGNSKDHAVRPELVMKVTEDRGVKTATIELVLDL